MYGSTHLAAAKDTPCVKILCLLSLPSTNLKWSASFFYLSLAVPLVSPWQLGCSERINLIACTMGKQEMDDYE